MYEEKDLIDAQAAVKRAMTLMLVPAVLFFGGAIWSFVVRIKWATILLSALAGCWIIFVHQNIMLPKKGYCEHVRKALRAARKDTEGYYLRMEATPVERDDVMFYAFYLNVGEKKDPEDDRLFYYDALKPLPGWQSGCRLRIISYDKFVASWEVVSGPVGTAASAQYGG